jgi:hypothetical protein
MLLYVLDIEASKGRRVLRKKLGTVWPAVALTSSQDAYDYLKVRGVVSHWLHHSVFILN